MAGLQETAAYAMLCRNCGTAGHVGSAVPLTACPSCQSNHIRTHPDLFALTIAHIDCDAFFASVEKLDNPARRIIQLFNRSKKRITINMRNG